MTHIGLNKCDIQTKICTEWKQWDSTSAWGKEYELWHRPKADKGLSLNEPNKMDPLQIIETFMFYNTLMQTQYMPIWRSVLVKQLLLHHRWTNTFCKKISSMLVTMFRTGLLGISNFPHIVQRRYVIQHKAWRFIRMLCSTYKYCIMYCTLSGHKKTKLGQLQVSILLEH
jgi:hypothetical protein